MINNNVINDAIRFGGRCEKHISVKPCQKCFEEKQNMTNCYTDLVAYMKWILKNSNEQHVKREAFKAIKSTLQGVEQQQDVCSMDIGCTTSVCLAAEAGQSHNCPVKQNTKVEQAKLKKLNYQLRGRIKAGALVSQDRAFGCWPFTHRDDNNKVDLVFDIVDKITYYECIADGYGRRSWLGEQGQYGNGSIYVRDKNGIDFIENQKGGDDS
jgi:hypothetical protein